jgi:ankyrin repeat protein
MNVLDNRGRSVLGHVVDNKNYPMLNALLNARVDPNQTDSLENTPLHKAAEMADPTSVQVLTNAGANLDYRNIDNKRPIDMLPALKPQRMQTMRNLLMPVTSRPAMRNIMQPDAKILDKRVRNTPLHIAAGTGDISAIADLLARGVDVNIQNNRGETAGMIAAQRSQLQTLDYLTTRPYFNFDAKDKLKNTILHHAAMQEPRP